MPTGFGVGITVVTQSLPDGIVGVVYDPYTFDALDYTPPIGWALQAGALPPGMALSGAGVLSGTPTQVGAFTFTVRATDGVPDIKDQVVTIRIGPDLGNVRRFQQETVVEDGTSVVPIEGRGRSDLRRKLERLLARVLGVQINDRYMLDAVDLQIRNFEAVPVQSIEDALLSLLGQIAGAARALDANGAGAPYVTPGGIDAEFNIVGLGSINVAKNIGLNQLEISFVGAPLSMPFDMLPAPSGDATGATDTAALVAFLAAPHQDWLMSPQDEADSPYYINADIGVVLGAQEHRISGKTRHAFRIVGVGAQRTWHGVSLIDNASLTNVRVGPPSGVVPRYEDCRLDMSLANEVLVSTGAPSARFLRCAIGIAIETAALYDGQNGGLQLALTETTVERTVGNAASFLMRTGNAAAAYLSLMNSFFEYETGDGLDLTQIHASSLIQLGMNMWSGTGPNGPIVRGATPATLRSYYIETLQGVGNAAFTPL